MDSASNPQKKPVAGSESLTAKASKNIAWNMASTFGVSGIRFISTAILARILMPEEFGIVAMAYLVMEIVNLFGNLGMGAALVQKKQIDDEYLCTAYWINLTIGLILTTAAFFGAPYAAMFFKNAVIEQVIQCLSVNFFVTSVGSVQTVLLTKNLRFKELALVEISCNFLRVSVILFMAFNGYSFWSIVFGIIAERLLKVTIFCVRSEWHPQFIFVREKFHEMFRFGRNLYGASFIGYLNKNMDFIVTGRLLGAADLGYYQFAFNLPHLVLTHFTQRISNVLFPLYSKVQDENERITRGYFKTITFVSLFTFPLMAGLAFVAHDFIVTVYGARWEAAVVPLQILCLSGAIKSIASSNGPLLMAKGRTDFFFKWNLAMFPITVLTIVVASRWGIIGVASGMSAVSLFGFVATYLCLHIIEARTVSYLKTVLPALVNSSVMVLCLWMINMIPVAGEIPGGMRLVANTVLGILFYLLSLSILNRVIMKEFLGIIRKTFGR